MNSKAVTICSVIEKLEIILGGIGALVFIMSAIVCTFDDVDDGVAVVIVIWIIGVLCTIVILFGIKRRKMRLKFYEYMAQLQFYNSGSIENLSETIGESQSAIKKNLRYMIDKKFFIDAYVDEKTNHLVFIKNKRAFDSKMENQNISADINCVTYVCPNCAGINKILSGRVSECEYCGSPILQNSEING